MGHTDALGRVPLTFRSNFRIRNSATTCDIVVTNSEELMAQIQSAGAASAIDLPDVIVLKPKSEAFGPLHWHFGELYLDALRSHLTDRVTPDVMRLSNARIKPSIVRSVQLSLAASVEDGESEEQPIIAVDARPAVHVQNSLPFDVAYQISPSSACDQSGLFTTPLLLQEGLVRSGSVDETVGLAHFINQSMWLMLRPVQRIDDAALAQDEHSQRTSRRDDDSAGYGWSQPVELHRTTDTTSDMTDSPSIGSLALRCRAPVNTSSSCWVQLRISHSAAALSLQLCVPVWLVDRTGLNLQCRQKAASRHTDHIAKLWPI